MDGDADAAAPPPAVATDGPVVDEQAASSSAVVSRMRLMRAADASGDKRAVSMRAYPGLTRRAGTMDRVRVLVVEDEQLLADAVAEGLRRESFAVDVAYDGDGALERLGVNEYDVLVLDRDLPSVGGDDVCRWVSAELPETRILMLTAASAVLDRVEGLSLGADDYLGKPFAFAELVARVRALGRRARAATPPVLERGDLRLDPNRREVFRAGRYVALTRKEFAVLEELLRAGGAVLSAEQLLERAWDEHIDPFTNVLRVTVMTLRRKLGDPPVIETVAGVGYQIR
ncbi:response regulator transcription factor [Dactylosporangium maewongense]|uniref:Response regulator transcription factor n=1 Tax=Dactylosporangium maewongense TaxID=634393 RepID=A0ABN1ZUC5_9ACTN